MIILLSFLAYSLTLVHALVPHHHHEEAKADHHHHHHSSRKDHHHHTEHDGKKSFGHLFADVIHHPASDVVIHTPQSDIVQKNSQPVDALISRINQLIFPELKPPDIPIHHREKHYSSGTDSFFLLRAPPVA